VTYFSHDYAPAHPFPVLKAPVHKVPPTVNDTSCLLRLLRHVLYACAPQIYHICSPGCADNPWTHGATSHA